MLNLNHIYGCVLNFNLILLIIYNYIVDFLETVNFIYYLKHIITIVKIFL